MRRALPILLLVGATLGFLSAMKRTDVKATTTTVGKAASPNVADLKQALTATGLRVNYVRLPKQKSGAGYIVLAGVVEGPGRALVGFEIRVFDRSSIASTRALGKLLPLLLKRVGLVDRPGEPVIRPVTVRGTLNNLAYATYDISASSEQAYASTLRRLDDSIFSVFSRRDDAVFPIRTFPDS